MFDMGFSEILFIVIIAIIFLGPDKLPDAIKEIAKFFRKIKSITSEAKETFEKEIHLQELRDEALHYKHSLQDATNSISSEFKHSVSKPIEEINSAMKETKSGLVSMNSMSRDSNNLIDDDFDRDRDKTSSSKDSDEDSQRPAELKS